MKINLFKKYNGNAMLSDSSDDSDIFNDSSDNDTKEDNNNDKIGIIKKNEFKK